METIDLGITTLEEPLEIDLNTNNTMDANIPGIELLMNDNVKKNQGASIDVGDLNNLEDELNNLAQVDIKLDDKPTIIKEEKTGETSYLSGFSDILGGSNNDNNNDTNVGSATKDAIGNTNTWDGFSKINDIPETKNNNIRTTMSEREMRRKKRFMIKKMEEWSDKGMLSNYSNYNMDSAFDEVEDEYETALEDKRKKDSVKLQGWWFTTLINSLEYANSAFDPFGINLDGWGETIQEDLDSYDEIFGELHEKYKGGKMAPELNLLLRIGFSAAVTNFTNKALSSSVPGFNDVIRQSPELMKAFTNATVNSMSQQSPGFAFANQMMQEEKLKQTGPPPPGPIKTRNQEPPIRPGQMAFTENPVRRPDINVARGNSENAPMASSGLPEFASVKEVKTQSKRPEMKGPSNIDSILSGLKPKNINLQQEKSENTGSVISVSSLNELTNEKLPKGTKKRKQKSDKNTISLDI
tara:strand:- start:1506 stop:2909 length:1404 start_codon:yes stop_codon:yes gene_type:complete